MNSPISEHNAFNSSVAIGLMALSLFSFSGCDNKPDIAADNNAKPAKANYLERGHNLFYIPTANGTEVSQTLSVILDENPGKSIGRMERTGSYTYPGNDGAGGAGFIVILQDSAK